MATTLMPPFSASLSAVRLGAGTGPVLLSVTRVAVDGNASVTLPVGSTYDPGKFYDVAVHLWTVVGVGTVHAAITLDDGTSVGEMMAETVRGYRLPANGFVDYGPLTVRGGSTLRFQRRDTLPDGYAMDVCVAEHVTLPASLQNSGHLVLPPIGRWATASDSSSCPTSSPVNSTPCMGRSTATAAAWLPCRSRCAHC